MVIFENHFRCGDIQPPFSGVYFTKDMHEKARARQKARND